jgi:Fe-S-cluster containining protein
MTEFISFKPGPKPLGSPTTIYRQHEKAFRAGAKGEVNVPCQGCAAGCCRSKNMYVELTASEAARFDHVIRGGKPVLRKHDDGACVYLIEGRCSVYHDRPYPCRVHDCRVLSLVGYMPTNDPPFAEALRQWSAPHLATAADRALIMAIRLATIDGGIPADVEEALAKASRAPAYLKMAKELIREIKRLAIAAGGTKSDTVLLNEAIANLREGAGP